ncbi:MAG: hypothetical protein OEN56_02195 [Gemmatimonadota bacterium]|nr:hypothetical protein [Gemmatimonadota bacterium]MDH3424855.1 hypothetical protein [Gemmatimonadota bacterium]
MTFHMKVVARSKAEQNRAAVDPWTVVHFAAGLAAGLVEAPLRAALPLAVLYEVIEQELERRDVGKEFFETSRPESMVNAAVDVAIFAAGHWLGRMWNTTR